LSLGEGSQVRAAEGAADAGKSIQSLRAGSSRSDRHPRNTFTIDALYAIYDFLTHSQERRRLFCLSLDHGVWGTNRSGGILRSLFLAHPRIGWHAFGH
jgi:hypothetical protein